MKILLLSDHSSLHMLLQQVLQERAADAQVWRTHTLASALPYLRQEPEIEAVMLDITLCGWSRLATLVTTLRPCLGHRKLVLLIDELRDKALVRAHGVSVDLCLSKASGVTDMVERLLQSSQPAQMAPFCLDLHFGPTLIHSPAESAEFTQLVW
jgi:DNA-binding NarL/FixJ family response regulator